MSRVKNGVTNFYLKKAYFVITITTKAITMKFSITLLFLICLSTQIDAQIIDTVFYQKDNVKTYSVGEVFYIGHMTIRIDNYKEIEVIPTESVFRISFQNKNNELLKDWDRIKNKQKNNISVPEVVTKAEVVIPEESEPEMPKAKIDYQILNSTYRAEIKQEFSLAATYLNKSANNQRNVVVFGTMSSLLGIGWASQVIKVANGGEPKGMAFYQTMSIGCSLASLVNYFMSISNLKQSSIHFQAASEYMGLSMVVPIR
jgi:hypothetical protein